MNRRTSQPLLVAGTMLVFFGLILGAALPAFTNPRMALSAHQQGIGAGSLLVVFGLAWPHVSLVRRWARATERLLIAGAYSIWIGSILAAIFGTSRATPIAGSGFAGARWQEIVVSVVLMLGSVLALVGVGSLLSGLLRRPDTGPEA